MTEKRLLQFLNFSSLGGLEELSIILLLSHGHHDRLGFPPKGTTTPTTRRKKEKEA